MMNGSLAANTISRPYRGLSVQDVEIPLVEADIVAFLLGREVYRRTEYLALRRGHAVALVAVQRESEEALFSPVTRVDVLAGPDQAVWIRSPLTDVGNATALATVALRQGGRRRSAYIVEGRYEHVNFIWEPSPVAVRVIEVEPPNAKLFAMAQQVVAFDDQLPPVELILDSVDIRDLAETHPAQAYLLPCRSSGVELSAPVRFLDTRPPLSADWLMIGCQRSVQFYRHFYGREPSWVDFCPKQRLDAKSLDERVLTKCCLLEDRIELEERTAVVPWGSTLDDIRSAVRWLVGVGSQSPRMNATPSSLDR